MSHYKIYEIIFLIIKIELQYHYLWGSGKAAFRDKLIIFNDNIRKEKKNLTSNLIFHLKYLGKVNLKQMKQKMNPKWNKSVTPKMTF